MTNLSNALDNAAAARNGVASAADASPKAIATRKATRKAKAPKRTRTTRNSAELKALKAALNAEAVQLAAPALLERFRLQTLAEVKAGGASDAVLKALKKARKARRKEKAAVKAAKAGAPSKTAKAPAKAQARKAKASAPVEAPAADPLAAAMATIARLEALLATPPVVAETPVAKRAKARKAALKAPAKESPKADRREILSVKGVGAPDAAKIAALRDLRAAAKA